MNIFITMLQWFV